jgi:thiosulfate/3-mercaptopyruvate sulfurtransferase
MKHVAPFLILCLLTLGAASTLPSAEGEQPVFVSTTWLAEHMNDPSLVILHVTQYHRDYAKGHIPGARFLWVGSMAMSNPELSFELVPVAQLDTVVEGLGISNDSRIVLCGVNGNVSPVARMFATFEYLGFGGKVSILDGGFDAWKAEGRPVTKEAPKIKRASFTPHLKKDAIVDYSFVQSRLHKEGISIVDARAPQFYNGIGGGSPRTGHIPGATNIYFSTLVDSTNKMLPAAKLREMFVGAGVKEGNEVITYCHVGQTASLDYVAARSLGYNAHLYDGSFEDWSGREELPIELPAKQDSTKK